MITTPPYQHPSDITTIIPPGLPSMPGWGRSPRLANPSHVTRSARLHPPDSIPWVRMWLPQPHCPNVITVWNMQYHTGEPPIQLTHAKEVGGGETKAEHLDRRRRQQLLSTRYQTNPTHARNSPHVPVASLGRAHARRRQDATLINLT